MYCWLCGNLLEEYYLLPEKEDEFQIPKICNYKIITVDKFTFLYYTICTNCLMMYLDNYPINFKKILDREITG